MNRPYSEATRDMLAEAEGARRNGKTGDGRGWFRTAAEREECYAIAEAALEALADLLPEGAETRTEWGARLTWDNGTVEDLASPSEAFARRRVAMHAEKRATRPGWRATADLISRDIRTGPWVLVDAVRLAEGDNKESQDHEGVSGV